MHKSDYLYVGEFNVYDSLKALDTGAYSEGLGKVILEDNEALPLTLPQIYLNFL